MTVKVRIDNLGDRTIYVSSSNGYVHRLSPFSDPLIEYVWKENELRIWEPDDAAQERK